MDGPTPPSGAGPPSDLRPALDAAYRGAEDEVIEALLIVSLRDGASASADEHWLHGELAYLEGRYADSIKRFEFFESRAREWQAPAWQRFGSAHRRMVALFRDGEHLRSRHALAEAERIVAANPELAFRRPNLDAMRGHFLELENDLDGARACFILAFQGAFEFRNWSRAASIAVDVVRIAVAQGNRSDALVWIEEARLANEQEPSRRVEQLIALGQAKAYLLARPEEARAIYDGVLKVPLPDRDVHALRERAELLAERGDFDDAEQDLQRAVRLCEQRGIRLVAMDVHRDLAYLYAARKGTSDAPKAASAFQRYAAMALSFPQPKPQTLFQLAEAVQSNPQLVGNLAPPQARAIKEALEECRSLMPPPQEGRALHHAKLRAALHRLESALQFLAVSELQTKNWLILPGANRAVPRSGVGESVTITTGELNTLTALLKAPSPGLTSTDLALVLNIGYAGANQAVRRLRLLLGKEDVLTVKLPRGFRAFSIAPPAPSS